MNVLVTGAAGFIGFHLSQKLLDRGDIVVGIDNLNDYYDVSLKEARLKQLEDRSQFSFRRLDLADRDGLEQLFSHHAFDCAVNLAAQAGVRYSLKNPYAYVDSNLVGFTNLLENCRHYPVRHLVFASSSSIYGANHKVPFAVGDRSDSPISLYAATKKANELMAYSYSHLYGIPTTGLRFFTVYGPWGRPDMALFLFTKAILEDRPIKVFNYGRMQRDFTYIDDIVEGIIRVVDRPPAKQADATAVDKEISSPPYRIYNIGNNHPTELERLIAVLETCLGKKAKRELLPMQPGDLPTTYADVEDLIADVGFRPDTPIEVGVERFVEWYRAFYSQ